MYQFVIIAISSYILGSIFTLKNGCRKYTIEFAKGLLVPLVSGFYVHSGLSYLMASVGVLAAQSRPAFSKNNGYTGEIVSLGIVFFMSPVFGMALALMFFVIKKITGNYDQAVFVSSLMIPVMAFKIFSSDSFIIISLIIFANLVIQFWPLFLSKRIKSAVLYDMAVGIGVLGFLILLYFNKYVYKGFGAQTDIIRHGPEQIKYVALTFDDGPDPLYTPKILDILKEKNVPATFFLIGKNAEAYPEIAKRIVAEGHSIGNHTYSHKSLIPLSAKNTYKEIKNAEAAIEEATGIRPTLFRPPRGVYSGYARKLLKEERYTLVLWDVSTEDWAELAPKKIVANVINRVKPGSIILLHDSGDLLTFRGGNRNSTVKALPEIIDKLRDEGYEFLTIDQMIFISELMETEEYSLEDYLGPIPAQ